MFASRSFVTVLAVLVCAGGVAAAPNLPNLQPAEPAPGVGTMNDYLASSRQDVQIRQGMLYVDGVRAKKPVFALRQDKAFRNTTATVQFRIDPVGTKRSFGLVFGAKGPQSYYAVHFDRSSVVLYEYRPNQPPKELARRAGFVKPNGQWYEAKIKTNGPQVKVWVDGRFVFAFNAPQLQGGHVGVYAEGGRAWVRKFDIGGTPASPSLPNIWRPR